MNTYTSKRGKVSAEEAAKFAAETAYFPVKDNRIRGPKDYYLWAAFKLVGVEDALAENDNSVSIF